MKFLHKYGTRPNEMSRARRELYLRIGLVVVVLLFFALMFLLSQLRPRITDDAPAAAGSAQQSADPISEQSLDSLRSSVDAVVAEYHAAVTAGTDPLQAMHLLDRAIEQQTGVIRSRTSEIAPRTDLDRLEELRRMKDGVMGEYLLAQSVRLEEEAEKAWREGHADEAIALLGKSMDIQGEINQQYPGSSSRDTTRLHELSGMILEWQAGPVAEMADRLLREAYQLLETGDYDSARRKSREALGQQKILHEQYRQSRYSTLARLRSFENAVKEMDAAEDVALLENHLRVAELALESGDHETAFSQSEKAEALQQDIIRNYSIDEAHQLKRLEQIQALKDTAASMPSFTRIQSLATQTRAALQRRDMDSFITLIAEWSREADVFVRRFKQSRLLEKMDTGEVDYLYRLRADIPFIQQMVYGNLAGVPGHDGYRLFKTEVNQALYESVTGKNPSIVKDALRPVDSVTWQEAVEFTRMLSTILSHPVFLPDETIYRSALGDMSQTLPATHAWGSANSDRLTQPCGTLAPSLSGFHDLLGNVAEWLDSRAAGNPASVIAIGGSARDSSARLASVPVDERAPDERNRYIGFRFVVDSRDFPK